MKLHDAVAGAAVALLGGAVIAASASFGSVAGQAFGPSLFPTLIGAGLVVCGLSLVAGGLGAGRSGGAVVARPAWTRSPRRIRNVLLVPGSLVFYVVASTALGFIPTAVIILAVMMAALGRRPVQSLGIAVVAALSIHTLFAKLLLVPLPWGLLAPVAW